MKKGFWKPSQELPPLPPHIEKLFTEVDPDWEWAQTEDWFIARLFDEDKEFERVACKIVRSECR